MTLTFNSKTYYEKSHLIIIGISNYRKEEDLKNAYNDAVTVKRILEEHYGFRSIVPPLFNERANKAEIEKILENILPNEEMIRPKDRLLIFYSGHGVLRPLADYEGTERNKGYIIPYDSEPDDFSSKIPMKSLVEGCQNCLAKHILLILDCCYSGYAALRTGIVKKQQESTHELLDDITSRRAIQVLAAGQKDQAVNDSGDRPGFSAFTGALLNILETGTDLDGDGILTASEIGSYLKREVPNQAIGTPQNPIIADLSGSKLGDFVFRVVRIKKYEPEPLGASAINGKILKNLLTYQNFYIFENLHIYSALNEIKWKSKSKIALITAGFADKKHDAINKLNISQFSIHNKLKNTDKQINDYTTSLCALLASPLLENNFVGIAPYSKLLVFDCTSEIGAMYSTHDDTFLAIDQAIEKRPDVILITMGSQTPPEKLLYFEKLINKAVRSGITVIGSSGNEGKLSSMYPAKFKDVLSVASIDKDDKKSNFSNYHQSVDISCYGTDIASAVIDNKWQVFSGGSFSSCIVAGAVALMYTINHNITPKDVHEIIRQSAEDIYYKNKGYDGLLGGGKLNVYKALTETKMRIGK